METMTRDKDPTLFGEGLLITFFPEEVEACEAALIRPMSTHTLGMAKNNRLQIYSSQTENRSERGVIRYVGREGACNRNISALEGIPERCLRFSSIIPSRTQALGPDTRIYLSRAVCCETGHLCSYGLSVSLR